LHSNDSDSGSENPVVLKFTNSENEKSEIAEARVYYYGNGVLF
jgi:hypothetical protein